MKNTIELSLNELDIHTEVLKTFQEKNLVGIRFSLETFGQKNPITVVKRNTGYKIVDGVSRFKVVQNLKWESLQCVEVDLPDSEILNHRITVNQTTKRNVTEVCLTAEHLLGILGTSQGKKRKSMGFDNIDNEDEFGTTGKDRFELTCHLLDLDMKPSNLRKLMNIFWFESEQPEEKRLGLLKNIDLGRLSIDKAHNILKTHEYNKEKKSKREKRDFEGKTRKGWYKLFCRSSLDMSVIPDGSVDLSIQSPPYYNLRKYMNQDVLCHGQEKTVWDYVDNELNFYREIRKKLKKNGVLIIIIGETYRGGYQGVGTKLETGLEMDGWKILDVNTWVKTNQKPTEHRDRFLSSYEKIIVATPNSERPTFNEVRRPSSNGVKLIKSTTLVDGTSGMSVTDDTSSITNVIVTPTFNKVEFKGTDSNFKHDAPCPKSIYKIFIDAYSEPGDTVLDAFCGSGTGMDVALEMGRNAIGFDVDPDSISFTEQRIQKQHHDRIVGGQNDKLEIAA